MIDRMQMPVPPQEPPRKPRQPLPAKPNGQVGFQELVQKAEPKQPAALPHDQAQAIDSKHSVVGHAAPGKTPVPSMELQRLGTVTGLVPQTVALHLDVPSGEREIVTLPWTLVANGVFGENLGRPGHVLGVNDSGIGVHPTKLGGMQFRAAMLVDSMPEEPASGSASSESAIGVAQGQTVARREEIESRERSRVDRQPASALASGLWQKKLLRILENHGDAAVYYRDYSLTHEVLDQVVMQLRDLAEQSGASVRRVLVNGTEVWSRSMQGGA